MRSNTEKLWLWIDPTRRCNLACELCYTKASHADEDLTPRNLEIMLDNIERSESTEIQKIHLTWRGEPLMNNQFPDLVRIISERYPDTPIEWHTNGVLLKKRIADKVLEASRIHRDHRVYVSIDGGNKLAHESNRGLGTYDKTLAGLETILDARGSEKRPQLGLYQLDMGIPVSEYDEKFLELANRVDIWARIAPVHDKGLEPAETTISADRKIEPGDAPSPSPQGACFWAGNSFCVAPNGDVHVCLLSHSKLGVVGNLIRETAEPIHVRAREYRQRLDTLGRDRVTHCTGCLKPCGDAHDELGQPPTVNAQSSISETESMTTANA